MKKGFTLLIAILASSLFLVIGATIFKIAFTQLTLSSIGKDSQTAFYAADTGAECALYWERKYYPTGFASPNDGSGSAFNTDVITHTAYDTSNRQLILATQLPTIQCLGGNVSNFKQGYSDGSGGIDATSFSITFGRACADVDVLKEDGGGGAVKTTITARGHNTCDTTDIRRVERTLQIILQ
jgi:hypothetical protein